FGGPVLVGTPLELAANAPLLVKDVQHRLHGREGEGWLDLRVNGLYVAGAFTPKHLHDLELQRCERLRRLLGSRHSECRLLVPNAAVNYKNSYGTVLLLKTPR